MTDPVSDVKTCTKCGEIKPYTAFYGDTRSTTGRKSECKACHNANTAARYQADPSNRRAWYLMRTFGISLDQFDAMLKAQGGRCAICRTNTPGGSGGTFHVDHCHTSARNRGLLCSACNRGIGFLKDDPAILKRAVHYLQHHSAH